MPSYVNKSRRQGKSPSEETIHEENPYMKYGADYDNSGRSIKRRGRNEELGALKRRTGKF